jgi:hypothetical protein
MVKCQANEMYEHKIEIEISDKSLVTGYFHGPVKSCICEVTGMQPGIGMASRCLLRLGDPTAGEGANQCGVQPCANRTGQLKEGAMGP